MLTLDYIGSKKSLLEKLDKVFEKSNMNSDTTFGDLFAGSGSVSYFVSKKYNANIVSNDLLYFSYVFNKAKLSKYTNKDINVINFKIDEYNNLKPVKSFITKSFSPPSRMYFTTQNAMKIDAIRTKLNMDLDMKQITNKQYLYLLASLLSATNKISNVSVVYAAYLKDFKQSAFKLLKLETLNHEDTVTKTAVVYNKDIKNIYTNYHKFDIVYLDPPYNNRQYGDNYHVLETIAKYNDFNLHGITGLPENIQKSKFASKTDVELEFKNLIDSIKTKVLILSYNSEGLLSKNFILKELTKKGVTNLISFRYKKFKAQQNVDKKYIREYIFVCNIYT